MIVILLIYVTGMLFRKTLTACVLPNARNLALAHRQLELGDISPPALIAADQGYARAQSALVQAQVKRFAGTVALFQALGGGWWNRKEVDER